MINDNPTVFKDLKELFPDLSEKTGLTDEQMQVILENMYYLYHNLGLANIDVGNTTTNFTAPGVFSNTELVHREEEVNGEVIDYLDFKFNIPTPKIQTEVITNTVSTPDDVNIDIINYPIIETINGQNVTTGYKFSFRADLYQGEGLKQNEIISRDVITAPTIDTPDFVQDAEGLKYKKKDGDSYSYESVGGGSGGVNLQYSEFTQNADLLPNADMWQPTDPNNSQFIGYFDLNTGESRNIIISNGEIGINVNAEGGSSNLTVNTNGISLTKLDRSIEINSNGISLSGTNITLNGSNIATQEYVDNNAGGVSQDYIDNNFVKNYAEDIDNGYYTAINNDPSNFNVTNSHTQQDENISANLIVGFDSASMGVSSNSNSSLINIDPERVSIEGSTSNEAQEVTDTAVIGLEGTQVRVDVLNLVDNVNSSLELYSNGCNINVTENNSNNYCGINIDAYNATISKPNNSYSIAVVPQSFELNISPDQWTEYTLEGTAYTYIYTLNTTELIGTEITQLDYVKLTILNNRIQSALFIQYGLIIIEANPTQIIIASVGKPETNIRCNLEVIYDYNR